MTRKERKLNLHVAVCADTDGDRGVLKAYIKERGWNDSGHEYRCEQWPNLLDDAARGGFNAVCAIVGGLRWFAQVAPDNQFERSVPKPKHEPAPVLAVPELDLVILERARAM